MLHKVKKMEYLREYKLKLTFNNKKQKIIDLQELTRGYGPNTVFYPFRDLEFFKSVRLDKELGTLVWPNGADLCPDSLYMMGEDI